MLSRRHCSEHAGDKMLTLWGRINSINVQKACWAIEELGLAYRRIDAGRPFGLNNTPEYLRMNPTGLVPTLDDDGFILWESNVIVRYLAAKHAAGSLCPGEPEARALADQWMDWQATAITPAMRDVFIETIRTPAEKRNAAAAAASIAATEPQVAILDQHLENNAYVAGDDFTMGDIATGAVAHRWLNLPIERQPRPALERWYAGLMERPAASSVLTLPLT
jgi:glutathione S-transferase